MRLLTRSTIVTVMAAGVLAAASTSAFAIVGGQASTHNYPGTAALSITFPGLGTAHCGGGLIHPRFVLTAAHCVSDQNAAPTPVAVTAAQVTVRVGSTDRTFGGVVATGARVYLHPDWMWGQPTGRPVSDLALVELDRDIRSVALLPISGRQLGDGDPVRLIGWGLTVFPPPPGADIPTMLQERDTSRQPATACAGGFIGTGEACLGGGACYGDSGSPALRHLAGRPLTRQGWASVGIASRETSQHDPCSQPSVYTDPSHPPFHSWIATTILRRQILPCTCPPAPSATPLALTRLNLLKLKNIR